MYNLAMFRPAFIHALRSVPTDFPDWEIVVVPHIRGVDDSWPDMGLAVRAHEIIDGLHREHFPKEFQNVEYAGSRRGVV